MFNGSRDGLKLFSRGGTGSCGGRSLLTICWVEGTCLSLDVSSSGSQFSK